MNIILEHGIKQGIKHGRIIAKDDEVTLNLTKMFSHCNSRKTALYLYSQQREKNKKMHNKKKQTECNERTPEPRRSSDLSLASFHTTTENLSHTFYTTPSMSPIMSYSTCASIPLIDLDSLDIDTDLSDISDYTDDTNKDDETSSFIDESSSFTTHSIHLLPQPTDHIPSDGDATIYSESSDASYHSYDDGYQYPWSHHESSDDEFADISEQAAMDKIVEKMKSNQMIYCDDYDTEQTLNEEENEGEVNQVNITEYGDISQYYDKERRYLSVIIYDTDNEGDDEDEEDLEGVRPSLVLIESETAIDEYCLEDDCGCNDIDSI